MLEKIVHEIQLDGYTARFCGVGARLQLGTYGSYGIEQLHIELGESWQGLVVYANFVTADGTTPVLVPESGLVDVPPEATAKPGTGNIVLDGTTDGVRLYSVNIPYIMLNHSDLSGEAPAPTPDRWEQYVAQVKDDADRADAAAGKAEDAAKKANDFAEKAEAALGNIGTSVTDAQAAANAAAQSAIDAAAELGKVQNASTEALTGIGAAKQSALTDIASAKDSAVSGIDSAGATQTGKVENAGAEALKSLDAAKTSAVSAVGAAGTKAEQDIGFAKESALVAISGAQGQATQAVQQAGANEVGKVTDAGAAQTKAIRDEGTKQTQAVTRAGDTKLAEIDAANALLPTPTDADAGKAVVVTHDGTGYELAKVQTDAYTKAESDARYAPIEAAIRPTVSGNPATLEHSVAWAMQGLNVYGKSTQDGTPSPDSPVPIVSAGESGSIPVTVSDGADQSQQLSIQTPNGLPGIPVDSGGNYTDAAGQQWVCDEVDFGRGVCVQRVSTHLIRDVSTISNSRQQNPNYFGCNNILGSDGIGYNKNLMPDKLVFVGIDKNINGSEITIVPGNGVLVFGLKKSVVSEETVEAVTNYLSENPITILYALKEPIETPLSEEQLAAYAALRTFDGTTVVATDAPVAGLSARYVADGTAYIDGKIQSAVTQAVAAAVSLTGGAQ